MGALIYKEPLAPRFDRNKHGVFVYTLKGFLY